MSTLQAIQPFEVFAGRDGLPLENGYLYFGAANLNPETNLITVYWDRALTIPAAQPIRTQGGYAYRNGSPSNVYIPSAYSLTVRDKNSALVFTDLNRPVSDNYTASGTGGVTRTIDSRLGDRVSLNDYDTLVNALATGKRVLVPYSTTSINVSASDSPTILQNLDRIDAEKELTLNLATGVHTTSSGNIANIFPNCHNITLSGATPVTASLTGITSVSGTSGDYTVVLTVDSATGIATGDYLKIDNAIPLLPLSGDNSVFRARIAQNELGNTLANLGNITTTTSGNTVAWSAVLSGSLSDYVSAGDLITIKGQTRVVTTVGASSVTITGTWDLGTAASRDWYITRPNSGTVGTGGTPSTTITGSGSAFTSEANVGDILLTDGAVAVITAISSDTSMTVSHNVTITTGAAYSIITAAVAHEGTHEITNVSGTSITVKNRWRGTYAPPVKRVSGGDVKALKTILRNTGTGDGLFFNQGASLKWCNNIVIKGDYTTTNSHGVALNGRTTEGPTQIGPVAIFNAGDGFASIGWGRGAFAGNGCVLQTRRSHYSGNTETGVWVLEGATANLRECIISGSAGRGVQANAGSTILFTEGHACGNGSDGLSAEEGTNIYAEIPVFFQNVGMGARFTGADFHVNECVAATNGASGVYGSSNSIGDLSRSFVCTNAREGVELIEGCAITANGVLTAGNTGTAGNGRGIYSLESSAVATDSASVSNKGAPLYFNGANADLDASLAYVKGTAESGATIQNLARARFSNGVVEEMNVLLGGRAFVDGVSPAPTLNGVNRLNEISARGSEVKNDSSTDGVGVALLRIAGGAVVDRLLTRIDTIDFGTIPATSSASTTVTVTGAATDDIAIVGVSNAGALGPAGVYFEAAVTSADTVTIRAYNTLGAGTATSVSLRTVVVGFA